MVNAYSPNFYGASKKVMESTAVNMSVQRNVTVHKFLDISYYVCVCTVYITNCVIVSHDFVYLRIFFNALYKCQCRA